MCAVTPWPTPEHPAPLRTSAGGLTRGLRALGMAAATALLLVLPGHSAATAVTTPATPATERWQAWAVDGFQHITSGDGLPNEIVTTVAEDGQGFIWTGTVGGVARWDGYQLRVHRFEPGRAGSLPDNVVQVMHRDHAGRLWVGTSGGGVARYDAATESFTTLGAGPGGLAHVSVRALADDGSGGLWVGSDGGLDHVDGASGRVTRVTVDGGASAGPTREPVGCGWAARAGSSCAARAAPASSPWRWCRPHPACP
jgi:ligand-binding sensor domain-containing protein